MENIELNEAVTNKGSSFTLERQWIRYFKIFKSPEKQ